MLCLHLPNFQLLFVLILLNNNLNIIRKFPLCYCIRIFSKLISIMKTKIYTIALLIALCSPLMGSASAYKFEAANSKTVQLPPPPPRPPLPHIHIGSPFHRRHYHRAYHRRHYYSRHRAHVGIRLPPHPPGPGLPLPPPRP
jgi:hypothetical protein